MSTPLERFLAGERAKREKSARYIEGVYARADQVSIVKEAMEEARPNGWKVEIHRGPDGLMSGLTMRPIDPSGQESQAH